MGVTNGGSLNPYEDQVFKQKVSIRKFAYTPLILTADAIIPPGANCVFLGKATAAAMTITAPTLAQNGDVLVITSQTNAAHTVTGVGLIGDGVTGSPHGTATFAAFIGASLTLMADNLLWNVIATTGITIT